MHIAALLDRSIVKCWETIRLQTVTAPWKAEQYRFLCEENNQPTNQQKKNKNKKSSLKCIKSQANMAVDSADCMLVFDRTTARSERQAVDSGREWYLLHLTWPMRFSQPILFSPAAARMIALKSSFSSSFFKRVFKFPLCRSD